MIYLVVGSIGVGKTSVGKVLAKKLGYEFYELDRLALIKSGFHDVSEAFAKSPTKFKESELQAAKELSTKDNVVIVMGGGVVENQLNFDYFREKGKKLEILRLTAQPAVQQFRIAEKYPHLDTSKLLENIKELNEGRQCFFQKLATKVVATDNKTVEEVVAEVLG